MGKRITQEEFLRRAREKHGDKYDYSKTDVNNRDDKGRVIITCPKHGDFPQDPFYHLSGGGCNECYIESQRMTTEEFIKRARKVHGDKYDYSKTDLTKKDKEGKIIITCPKHGDFKQTPNNHLRGNICRKCYNESKMIPKEEFVERARKVHGDKYDYTKTDMFDRDEYDRILVTCPIHGDFRVRVDHHLEGSGCKLCGFISTGEKLRLTQEEFIEKARKIHGDKYDYSKVNYIKYDIEVTIICPKHGEFQQKPSKHLVGHGCQECNNSKLENIIKLMLEENDIEFEHNKFYDSLDNLQLDFYIPSKKIAIECQGMQHFEPVEHFGGEERHKETVRNDKKKAALCEKEGITLLYFSNLGIEYPYKVYENKDEIIKIILG